MYIYIQFFVVVIHSLLYGGLKYTLYFVFFMNCHVFYFVHYAEAMSPGQIPPFGDQINMKDALRFSII